VTAPDRAVRRFLDLSITHLTPALARNRHTAQAGDVWLGAVDGVTAYQVEYGWLMWVPDDPETHASDYDYPRDGHPFPEVVLTIQRYARDLGCDYVLFDADAEALPDLPTFE
jgi:hypothetical protein